MNYAINMFISSFPGSIDQQIRNNLGVAYKNLIGQRRTALRQVLIKIRKISDNEIRKTLEGYKLIIKDEMIAICMNLIDLIQNKILLVDRNMSIASKCFFQKMTAD
mmetsp:Transcript_59208/g.50141  ORF Transcript_59208/g.50141 Transcript_59208/m.50141 type:complete len:106 (-) Transcript_59208:356-673(-)